MCGNMNDLDKIQECWFGLEGFVFSLVLLLILHMLLTFIYV
jgi:hypothetical protein